MLVVGMPLPPEMQAPATNDWSAALTALVAIAVLIVVGAVYGWITGRLARPVRMRPTMVSRAVEEHRKAA
ncbi:MAG: hypothetical protein HYU54_08355 [Actinobacteria bacterium]|nr:hypothetical protein [Actinomycetota bacterium]